MINPLLYYIYSTALQDRSVSKRQVFRQNRVLTITQVNSLKKKD